MDLNNPGEDREPWSLTMKRILLACVVTVLFDTYVRADWQDIFSYDVSVANSPDGPFNPDVAMIYSAGSHPFTQIGVVAQSFSPGLDIPNGASANVAYAVLLHGKENFASLTHSPFFIKVSINDKASGLTDSVILGGSFDRGLQNSSPLPTFNGQVKRQIGNRIYDVTSLPPMPGFPEGSPGAAQGPDDLPSDWYLFTANITSSEVAPTPEPATLVMAIAGALGMATVRRWPNRWHR